MRTVVKININDLEVNKQNARHGILESEEEAIHWLLTNKKNKIQPLARDIASKGVVYERPILVKDKEKYFVYDGNKRITCLKLLNDPLLARDDVWIKFFKALKDNNSNIPEEIECDVLSDKGYANDWVERKHVGGETGKGQVKWGKTEKENHLLLTGQKMLLPFVMVLQNEMRNIGLLSAQEILQHSIFERLLSSNVWRNRLGFSLERGEVIYLKDEKEVFNAIYKIHIDSLQRKETLKTLWNNKDKARYLDSLQQQGFLPVTNKKIENNLSDNKINVVNEINKNTSVKQINKLSLIDIDFPIKAISNEELKIKAIWDEMKLRLSVDSNPYSLGVMVRVLLELSTDYCLEKNTVINAKAADKLNVKMIKVIGYLETNKFLNSTESNKLKGTANVDINNLHSFVHDLNSHPTKLDLVSLWGKFKKYIKLSLEK